MAIRLLIICDIRLYREGLERGLRQRPEFDVLGSAATAAEAIARAAELRPELVLVDVGGAADLRLLSELGARGPQLRLVALGVADEPDAVLACVEAGAAAYVGRDASLDELAATVAAAARGEVVCSPRIAASLFQRVAALAGGRSAPDTTQLLTDREREILLLIEQGCSNKEIARSLHVKVATVKNHVHHILEKLGVSRRGAAAAMARAQRVPPHPAEKLRESA